MLCLLLTERKKKKKKKQEKARGLFSQVRHALLAVPHQDFS
jgi:hypothetical protein